MFMSDVSVCFDTTWSSIKVVLFMSDVSVCSNHYLVQYEGCLMFMSDVSVCSDTTWCSIKVVLFLSDALYVLILPGVV